MEAASGRRLGLLLAVATGAVAFVVRAVYAFGARPSLFYGNDNTWYVTVARSIASGHAGKLPGLGGSRVWSLRFPPGYPVVLAAGQRLLFWVGHLDADRWTSIALGAAAAATVTWLAWRLADQSAPRLRVMVAVVAGTVFALNPITAGASAALMSESLFLLLVALVLLAVDGVANCSGGRGLTAVLAGAAALGALTRVEGVAYLAVPIVVGIVSTPRRAARRMLGVALAAPLVAAVGWTVWASSVAGTPVAMATNGTPLLGANCAVTQHGDGIGSWSTRCLSIPAARLSPRTVRALAQPIRNPYRLPPAIGADLEADLSRAHLREALRRIRDNPGGTVRAVPFRLARGVGVFWSGTQTRGEVFEGRGRDWEAAGRWWHLLVVLPLALLGLAAALTSRTGLGTRLRALVAPRRLAPALVLLGVWLVAIAVTYGSARLRAPVEPVLAVLAGLGAALLVPVRFGARVVSAE